ncbi:MAG: 2-amino-4-hydroxy-6-hydroxymethyldihydropteridine diphosphokinase [Pontimonas sp.]|jgi:2-amino-4-hydroxy-6-hydroxymethyldihydropteridine diphosphokinase
MDAGWTRCVVAVGANLGDKETVAFQAVSDLRATEGFSLVACSGLHETTALTTEGFDSSAPSYLNQVVVLDSAWSPQHTLQKLHDIEQAHGRVRTGQRYADRTLDLDLITYGEEALVSPSLTLPHPRAHERRFVLEPWLEVDPSAQLPGHGPLAPLLAALPEISS